ncbi:MAG: ABC transporter substrate-binding protein [Lachnospiraceae bacterium]|nr:ABC transporter substrate-binding protein [Lachnospiraceae bacterium]
MKKILSVLLATTMVAGVLAGCGSSASETAAPAAPATAETTAAETTEAAETTTAAASDKVYHIGINQQLEHPALDAASEGFQAALTELLGENVVFDVKNAQGEQANCASIASQFVADNDDLILAVATTALQCSAAATNEIPILGTAVTDYATALDIADWKGTTGSNISGTSDCAPLDQQEDMLLELFPEVKKVGILYCSAEANSVYQASVFGEELKADGIDFAEFTVADSNDIQSVVTNAVEECDVLYIPTDNTMANNTEAVNNIAQAAGVPIIAGEEGICSGCGVATLSIDYYELGYTTGQMAYDILVNGADVSTMEIQYAPNVTKEYNKTICDALSVTVPEDYVAIEE